MVSLFLGIVLCYTLAAVIVLAIRFYRGQKQSNTSHYVLVGANHELQMEGYIRAIRWSSLKSGSPVKITVVDEGSTDETRAIVEKLARDDKGILLYDGGEETPRLEPAAQRVGAWYNSWPGRSGVNEPHHYLWLLQAEGIVSEADHAIVVDLRQPEQLEKLPR
ncbi:hypothetical protein ACFOQM_11555 [Paenibacillus sp. GCM10012307]|uniref:Uncharacterized protein n=1 Tax=Paenibacillus roseus TaxID=2798579 RepID=A0A934IZ60_9BACL|nr:hypothetical protein [Paenibacillus roseus]MBJ6361921.1 hypothetical protein [Paenibacillus roseus]